MTLGEAGADYLMFGEPRPDGSLPALDEVVERAAWWAEIFETPCVAFAPTSRTCRRSPPRGPSSSRSARRSGRTPSGPAAAVRPARSRPCRPTAGTGHEARGSPSSRSRASRSPRPAPAAPTRSRLRRLPARATTSTAFREATARLEKRPDDAAAMTLLGELYNQGLGVARDPVKGRRMVPPRRAARRRARPFVARPDGARRARHGEEPGPRRAPGSSRPPPKASRRASYNLALLLLSSGRAWRSVCAPWSCCAGPPTPRSATRSTRSACSTSRGAASAAIPRRRRAGSSGRRGTAASPARSSTPSCSSTATAFRQNEERAARGFRRAAARGNAIAQNRLARLYAAGRGVPQNKVEAAAWHLMAPPPRASPTPGSTTR